MASSQWRQLIFEHILVRESECLPGGEIDLLILCRSWEARSLVAFEKLAPNARRVAMVEFNPTHAPPATSEASQRLEEELRSRSAWLPIELSRSTHVGENFGKLQLGLGSAIRALDRAARVVVDISSLPKYYSMATLAWLLKTAQLCRVTCVYSEGTYGVVMSPQPQENQTSPDHTTASLLGRFTSGEWTMEQVTYLEGKTGIDETRFVAAFCGADEDRIVTLLEKYENLRRHVFICGTDITDLARSVAQRREIIMDQVGLEKENVTACDPFSICEPLVQIRNLIGLAEPGQRRGLVLFPFSTKPHAVASAVAGFNPSITVFCRVPASYTGRKVDPTGRSFTYELVDLSNLHSQAVI